MDRLQGEERIDAPSRIDLTGNRLVVIARPGADTGGDPFDWLIRTGGRLAIGQPDSVPAGRYAFQMLTAMGLGEALGPRLVMATDVRAVRTFVERGEAAMGIVYRSDTVAFYGVQVVSTPPPAAQPRIVCPAALTVDAGPQARRFLNWMQSERATLMFTAAGFTPVQPA